MPLQHCYLSTGEYFMLKLYKNIPQCLMIIKTKKIYKICLILWAKIKFGLLENYLHTAYNKDRKGITDDG